MAADANPTGRFSDRVDTYVKHRPGYPEGLKRCLAETLGLAPGRTAGDVGAGTGIFSGFLLQAGYRVLGVEPNPPMRAAAEKALAGRAGYASVAGTSEATTLPDQSVDFITAAQAFHWFEPAGTKREFRRVLKEGGPVVLIWNDRVTTGPFASDYEDVIRSFSSDYSRVDHKNVTPGAIRDFLGSRDFGSCSFENFQTLDLAGLVGRLTSSSYAPNVGHPAYPAMIAELEKVFARHQNNGIIRIDYDTRVYHGTLRA
jgi:SAM-dependent methyltransferase